MSDMPAERFYRDARITEIYEGRLTPVRLYYAVINFAFMYVFVITRLHVFMLTCMHMLKHVCMYVYTYCKLVISVFYVCTVYLYSYISYEVSRLIIWLLATLGTSEIQRLVIAGIVLKEYE